MYLELSLPICAFVFSLILCIVYFSKRRINLIENKVYSLMIVAVLINSLLATIEKVLVIGKSILGLSNFITYLLGIMYKFDASILVIICSCIFMYIFIITLELDNNRAKKMFKYIFIVNAFSLISIFFLKIGFIENNGIISVNGSFLIPTYFMCAMYILASTFVSLTHISNITIKHFPLIFIVFVFGLLMVLFIINPYITIISICLTVINFIMYFTIENPDMGLIKELEIARDNAIQSEKAKTDFLSSMSHEIRTPLNAIIGLSEDISSYNDKVPSEVRDDSRDIVLASQSLLEIIGNILDINVIENSDVKVSNVCYNFVDEIKSVVKVAQSRIGGKDIKIRIDMDSNIPYEFIGDKVRIREVISNLLSNAIKFTDSGEVYLYVKCINSDSYSNLTISVKDSGKGIKEEDIGKLFNKFERLDTEKNSNVSGTGLGLALTYDLVNLLGGSIRVKSRYGYGSIFIVDITQKISKLTCDNSSVDSSVYVGKRVLIVDDNKLNIKVAKRALASFDMVLDECYNGEECICKIMNDSEYDLILMDIMMPVMDGVETFNVLKKQVGISTPIIALTADALAESSVKYLNIGFDDYISKPFTREQIKKKIDNIFK